MIQRCIYSFVFWSLFACQTKDDQNTTLELVELVVVDSVSIIEDDYFVNTPQLVELLGDSLVAISSIRTPSVSFLRLNGEQVAQIASKDFPEASFFPSSFEASDFPIIYILDQRGEAILTFDVDKGQFQNRQKLKLPEGKKPKTSGAKFKKLDNSFLVELESSVYDNYQPDYYRKAGSLIYLFDSSGRVKDSFLDFPSEMKAAEGSLKPIDYLKLSSDSKSLLFSFPHSKSLQRFEIDELDRVSERIILPESKYFDYQVLASDKIVSFAELFNSGAGLDMSVPYNHYFNKIIENDDRIFIATWMNNRAEGDKNATYSHLLIYDKDKREWSETANPLNILDIGMLAGVVNDTLYFYEGSLMKHDEKYIKRAVLRRIEE